MGFKISVEPSGHTFTANDGETVLDAALRHGVTLAYGCRSGYCGACRGKVVDGQIDHNNAHDLALDEADRAAGFALFCCAHAKSDLRIEAREIGSEQDIPKKTLPAKVQKLTRASPDVMLVELKLPPGEQLQFVPGQYIEILLNGGARRAFSLANAPRDDSCLQLHIRRIPGGQFTEHVFNEMKERDLLRINGPHGSFFLREDSAKPMLLIAGGTGFAPIKAIVEHAIAKGSKRSITLYWGARNKADLYLCALAEQWAQDHEHIRFVPVLSDSPESEHWQGRTGLVHQAAMHDFPDLSGHQVYVCGSPAMVTAARGDFVRQCHLTEDNFFSDSFEFANDKANTPQLPENSSD